MTKSCVCIFAYLKAIGNVSIDAKSDARTMVFPVALIGLCVGLTQVRFGYVMYELGLLTL